jgi:outer membrane protein assembly factor BamB
MLATARLLALIPHAAAAAHESLQPTAAPLASRDWPQMGRTPSFESTSNVSVSGAPHAEWTFKGATSRLISSPAVYDGIVYVGCDDGHLYALEVNTGRQLWAFAQSCMPATAEKCGGNGIRSSPAVASDGSVAFGSYDGHAYKVDKMGKLLWQYKVPKPIYSPATIDSDGTVYVGTMRGDNCLYAINGDSGKLKWKACGERLFGEMNSGAAIGAPGGPAADIVVVNNFDKNIRAFDRSTGKLVWLHKVGGPSGGSATIVGSTAYIGSWDRNFYALDIHTGASQLVLSVCGCCLIACRGRR